jgi:hypothetical protein
MAVKIVRGPGPEPTSRFENYMGDQVIMYWDKWHTMMNIGYNRPGVSTCLYLPLEEAEAMAHELLYFVEMAKKK